MIARFNGNYNNPFDAQFASVNLPLPYLPQQSMTHLPRNFQNCGKPTRQQNLQLSGGSASTSQKYEGAYNVIAEIF